MVVEEITSFFPACWTDDTRMNALFAPFRPKSSNPESWNSKMAFWSDLLKSWCIDKRDPTFSENEARNAFMRGGRRPACLSTLVQEMQKDGAIVSPSYYSSMLDSSQEGWIKWGTKKALRPVGFALTYVASYIVKRNEEVPLSDQKFVIPVVVKHQAETLLTTFSDDSETVGTIQELMECTSMKFTNEDSFRIILGYLMQQKLAVRKGNLFKLGKDALSRPSHITESDEALWRIRIAVKRLNNSAMALEARGEQALKLAKAALAAGDRIAAKGHLRRKHGIVERHTKCLDALDNVKTLAEALKQSETDTEVVNTYRSGVKALKNTMADKDLSEDTAYNTMDDLKEVLDSCVEIETTISKPVDNFNMEELEQELADLLASDSGDVNYSQGGNTSSEKILPALPDNAASMETRKLLLELPDVPGSPRDVASPRVGDIDAAASKNEVKKSKLPVAVGTEIPTDAYGKVLDTKKVKLKQDSSRSEQVRSWYQPENRTLQSDQLCSTIGAMQTGKKAASDHTDASDTTGSKLPLYSSYVPPSSTLSYGASSTKNEQGIDELERRLKGLRGIRDPRNVDLPDLDSEDDEVLSDSWSSGRPSN